VQGGKSDRVSKWGGTQCVVKSEHRVFCWVLEGNSWFVRVKQRKFSRLGFRPGVLPLSGISAGFNLRIFSKYTKKPFY